MMALRIQDCVYLIDLFLLTRGVKMFIRSKKVKTLNIVVYVVCSAVFYFQFASLCFNGLENNNFIASCYDYGSTIFKIVHHHLLLYYRLRIRKLFINIVKHSGQSSRRRIRIFSFAAVAICLSGSVVRTITSAISSPGIRHLINTQVGEGFEQNVVNITLVYLMIAFRGFYDYWISVSLTLYFLLVYCSHQSDTLFFHSIQNLGKSKEMSGLLNLQNLKNSINENKLELERTMNIFPFLWFAFYFL